MRKRLLEQKEDEYTLEYGTILPLTDEGGKLAIFLVLPLWLGGDEEARYLQQAVSGLIAYLRDNKIKTVAIEEVGVKRLGYPR